MASLFLSYFVTAMMLVLGVWAQNSTSPSDASSSNASAFPTPSPTGIRNLALIKDHNIHINVTAPVKCQPMNITFDPSKGVPPFTVMIAIEDWWPFVVELPKNYDSSDKALWLYQYTVPMFKSQPKAPTNPNLIVSITDSTGLMSNSSKIVQVQDNPSAVTCDDLSGGVDFTFFTQPAPSQCSMFDIGWSSNFTAPMSVVLLPEALPPIHVAIIDPMFRNQMLTLAIPGGTKMLMTMGDAGKWGNGGVSRFNIVGLNEYTSNDCLLNQTQNHQILAAQTVASTATVFPDVTSTIASLTTSNGIVSTVTILQTIKNGRTVRSSSGISITALITVLVAIGVGVGIGAGLVWYFCCYRKRQKRHNNIKSWDLPSDSSVAFNADPHLPIEPGVFGLRQARQLNNPSNTEQTNTNSASDSRLLSHSHSMSSANGIRNVVQHTADNRADSRPRLVEPLVQSRLELPPQENSPTDSGSIGSNQPPSTPHPDSMLPPDSDDNGYEALLEQIFLQLPNSPDHPQMSEAASAKALTGRAGSGPTHRSDYASQIPYTDSPTSLNSANSHQRIGTFASMVDGSVASSAAFSERAGRGQSYTSRGRGYPSYTNATLSEWGQQQVDSFQGDSLYPVINTSSSRGNGSVTTRFIRHADAGLLLDDSTDADGFLEDDGEQIMELPSQYESLQPRQELPAAAGQSNHGTHLSSSPTSPHHMPPLPQSQSQSRPLSFLPPPAGNALESGYPSPQGNAAYFVGDEDESQFWTAQ